MAKASLEELRLDSEDFLQQRRLQLRLPDDPRRKSLVARRGATADQVAAWVKEVAGNNELSEQNERHGQNEQESQSSASMLSIRSIYAGLSANAVLVLIGVAVALLGRQVTAQANAFETEGGFTERFYETRRDRRQEVSAARLVKGQKVLDLYGG